MGNNYIFELARLIPLLRKAM